jgi:DHA1 family multidrug resistance protein-like MFS transporter
VFRRFVDFCTFAVCGVVSGAGPPLFNVDRMDSWKRNFYLLLAVEILALAGFQAVHPFVPYYIQTFGVRDLSEALIWSGYMETAGALALAVCAPVWGYLADRFGPKPMVVRSMVGGGIAVLLMTQATTLEQLFAARIFHGMMSGSVTACIILVSKTAPKSELGYAMGLMQAAFMLGASLGPLAGGPMIEHWGFYNCFVLAGATVIVAGLAVQLMIKDSSRREGADSQQAPGGFVRDSRRLLNIRSFTILLVGMVFIHFSFGCIMPVLPLYLQQLAGGAEIVSLAGLVFALRGLTSAGASVFAGKWSNRFGSKKTMICALLGTAVFLVAQGSATDVASLAVITVVAGVAFGAIRPLANVMIAEIVRSDDRGKAFGITTSASAFGFATGPVVGANLGAAHGFPAAFYLTSLLFVATAVWVWWAIEGRGADPRLEE